VAWKSLIKKKSLINKKNNHSASAHITFKAVWGQSDAHTVNFIPISQKRDQEKSLINKKINHSASGVQSCHAWRGFYRFYVGNYNHKGVCTHHSQSRLGPKRCIHCKFYTHFAKAKSIDSRKQKVRVAWKSLIKKKT